MYLRSERMYKLVFACWYKFRRAKSYTNDFGVGIVKNVFNILGYETLKLAVSQKLEDELFCFFA